MIPDSQDTTRLIAFYLPQYHPISENDIWWGKGFTEWRNVAKARPLFKDHYQPHLPADLGFYDLRLVEAREAQAELAREYGIHGFCYYHYWFNGRRILERPFNEVLTSGSPDFPFCLCWANENWTRTWDGGADDILLRQNYSDEDDRAHIRSLLPALVDSRYIRVDGKPLILIYRTELLPNPGRTANIWRSEATRAGVGDLYLARVESFVSGVDPLSIGFDAAVEFAPDWRNLGEATHRGFFSRLMARLSLKSRGYLDHRVYDYSLLVDRMLKKSLPPYRLFRCVCPSFDNSPRRNHNAVILDGSSPEQYYRWFKDIVKWTVSQYPSEKRLVFINAWNEWGEGNHLEPDQRWGRAYLEMTAKAVHGEVSR